MSDATPADTSKPKRKPRKAAARKKAPGKTAAKSTAGLQREGGEGTPPAADPTTLIRVPMPVRWRDLDAFNHVNNSKYLSFLEEARLQWMMEVPGQGLDEHVAPVVAAAHLNYRRPITWPAEIAIELFVERLGNTSLTVGHRIVDAANPATLYCDGNVVMVWIDRDSGAAAALPETVRTACSPDA